MLIKYFTFIFFSTLLSCFDIKYKHIPLTILLIENMFLIFENVFLVKDFTFLFSSLIAFIFFMILRFSVKKIGMGDVYFSFTCGLMLNFIEFCISMIIASFLGILFLLLLNSKLRKNFKLPFIPFMFFGVLCLLLYKI